MLDAFCGTQFDAPVKQTKDKNDTDKVYANIVIKKIIFSGCMRIYETTLYSINLFSDLETISKIFSTSSYCSLILIIIIFITLIVSYYSLLLH